MPIWIKYKDAKNNEVLGDVEKSGLSSIVIPKPGDSHSIFLNREFTLRPDINNWEITNHNIGKDVITLSLIPIKGSPKSYGHAADEARQGRTTHFLKKYRIVEVDFGHHISLLDPSSSKLSENTTHLSYLMRNELHKRRPCIVIGLSAHSVQILPFTTKTYGGINNPVSKASLMNLSKRYTDQTTYMLPDKIQSVSAYRVFPVKTKEHKWAKVTDDLRVCEGDMRKIEELLSLRFKPALKQVSGPKDKKIRDLQSERVKNLATIEDAKNKLASLEAFVLNLGREYGASGSAEDIVAELSTLLP